MRDDVIHYCGRRHPSLTLAVHAQWMLGEETNTRLLPSVVIATLSSRSSAVIEEPLALPLPFFTRRATRIKPQCSGCCGHSKARNMAGSHDGLEGRFLILRRLRSTIDTLVNCFTFLRKCGFLNSNPRLWITQCHHGSPRKPKGWPQRQSPSQTSAQAANRSGAL